MEYSKLEKIVGTGWAQLLKSFMVERDPKNPKSAPYYEIADAMRDRMAKGENILPDKNAVYRAFLETPLENVRIVLLGQDPYPGAGFPNGLAFGTDQQTLPVSLVKIFEGLEQDVYNGLDLTKNQRTGDLVPWAKQGVLLLNSSLTVKQGTPGEHADIWKPFIEFFIKELTAVKRDLIWIGMGTKARKYLEAVNPFRNFVYWCEHPAAAARDGNRPWKHNNVFTKANLAITVNNIGEPIKW